MNVIEILRQTLESFRAHKMRMFLTMFGIVWGIASVILLVGLGRGFSVDSKKRMQTLGKDLVIVWGGRTSSQVGGLAAGREVSLTIEDARLVRDECYQVKNVSPELRRSVPEVSQFNSANRGVVGMWPSYQQFRSLLLRVDFLPPRTSAKHDVWLFWAMRPASNYSADSPRWALRSPSREFPTA